MSSGRMRMCGDRESARYGPIVTARRAPTRMIAMPYGFSQSGTVGTAIQPPVRVR
jgi:hypothetical protein